MPDRDERQAHLTDDRRTRAGAAPGEDPREIDAEYTSPEVLTTWAAQDRMRHAEPGEEGMGTSSDVAPGADLPVDADPELGER